MKRLFAMSIALLGYACMAYLHAQNPDPLDIRACTAIETDAQRLACYDRATGRNQLPAADKKANSGATASNIFAHRDHAQDTSAAVAPPVSLLDSRWELSPESKLGTFNLRGYKPIYILPVFYSSNMNRRPTSGNPLNTVSSTEVLDNVEAKFQLSLKTKLVQGVFGDVGDVWVGYTQSSRWQVYNSRDSRPFRETDYEPEALLVFNTNYHVFGWDGRMLAIGVNHQSNGQADPLSRSWNRVIANIGFERDNWTVTFRPWWRIPESAKNDNNPNIQNYMGRGEAQIIHEWNGQEFGLTLRDSFRGGSNQRGSGRLTYSFPIFANLRGYAEVFKGYGESLIDYNHNATYVGLGVSLLDWY